MEARGDDRRAPGGDGYGAYLAKEESVETSLLDSYQTMTTRSDEETLVRDWRWHQLRSLGIPRLLALSFVDEVDWHDVAALVARGCPPLVALQIAW